MWSATPRLLSQPNQGRAVLGAVKDAFGAAAQSLRDP